MNILLLNIYMYSNLDDIFGFLVKLLLAMLCSAVIGIEREAKHRPAGLRTHVIVCVASTLIMSVGILLKDQYINQSPNIDPARLAAQIISGIGFLGAGTIIKGKDSVFGLTTAATLWAVACLGITVGSGYYIEAIAATACIMLVLRVINYIEKYYQKKYFKYVFHIDIEGPLENVKRVSMILGYGDITVDYVHLTGIHHEEDEDRLSLEVAVRSRSYDRKFEPLELVHNYDFIKKVYEVSYPKAFR